MTAIRIRSALRWAHIVEAFFVGFYVYSPLHSDPFWTVTARIVVFLAAASGVCMWQQGRLTRWLRRRSRSVLWHA